MSVRPEPSRAAGTAAAAPGDLLAGRVVMLTGATGHLGRVTAHALARSGARLALVGRDAERVEQAYAADPLPMDPLVLGAELGDRRQTSALVEGTLARWGRIDGLIHTAGAFSGPTPFLDTGPEIWDRMLAANLRATAAVLGAVVPAMLQGGGGSCVVVAARAALAGRPGLAAYCAAKAGTLRLVESLAAELRGSGVRVNCLLPEAIAGPGAAAQGSPDAVSAEDLADLLLLLLSDRARALSGAAIPV